MEHLPPTEGAPLAGALASAQGAPPASASPASDSPTPASERLRRQITRLRVVPAVLGILLLVAVLDDTRAFVPGAVVALFGEAIQLWASSHVYRKIRRLTTSGPYARVRNPMYIGRFFVILGFFVMTGKPWLCVLYAVIFAAYAHVRVLREEKFLEGVFGEPYREYCAQVRSWLPSPSPWAGAEARAASWQQVCVNHENLNLYILLALLLVIRLRMEYLPHANLLGLLAGHR